MSVLSTEAVREVVRGRMGIGVVEGREATQFGLGRSAAQRAMADLGTPAEIIPAGPDGAPIWPDRLVGSIAHTRSVAIAVVGWAAELDGLGVDVEDEGRRIDPRTARRICTPEERPRFAEPATLLALFCAKEATYKALAPLGATRLGFQAVTYTQARPGVLEGRIVNDAVDARVPRTFTARYTKADGFVVAAVQIDRRG
jgi:4'-phosphopantetheinyl transferase EntD